MKAIAMKPEVMIYVHNFLKRAPHLTLFEVFDKIRFADAELETTYARNIVQFLMDRYAMVNCFSDGPAVNYGINAIYNYFMNISRSTPDDFRDALRNVFDIERDITERPTILGELSEIDCGL